jgi:hypothetical protein
MFAFGNYVPTCQQGCELVAVGLKGSHRTRERWISLKPNIRTTLSQINLDLPYL